MENTEQSEIGRQILAVAVGLSPEASYEEIEAHVRGLREETMQAVTELFKDEPDGEEVISTIRATFRQIKQGRCQ